MANIKINKKLFQRVVESFRSKDTQELSNIWKKNDLDEYGYLDFEAIKQILIERGEELPPQDEYSEKSVSFTPFSFEGSVIIPISMLVLLRYRSPDIIQWCSPILLGFIFLHWTYQSFRNASLEQPEQKVARLCVSLRIVGMINIGIGILGPRELWKSLPWGWEIQIVLGVCFIVGEFIIKKHNNALAMITTLILILMLVADTVGRLNLIILPGVQVMFWDYVWLIIYFVVLCNMMEGLRGLRGLLAGSPDKNE